MHFIIIKKCGSLQSMLELIIEIVRNFPSHDLSKFSTKGRGWWIEADSLLFNSNARIRGDLLILVTCERVPSMISLNSILCYPYDIYCVFYLIFIHLKSICLWDHALWNVHKSLPTSHLEYSSVKYPWQA